jgi:hypothetical protein
VKSVSKFEARIRNGGKRVYSRLPCTHRPIREWVFEEEQGKIYRDPYRRGNVQTADPDSGHDGGGYERSLTVTETTSVEMLAGVKRRVERVERERETNSTAGRTEPS